MSYRKLRIAWSVLCTVTCVLLIALWLRSYSWCDTLYWNRGNPEMISLGGKLQVGGQFMVTTPPMPPPVLQGRFGKLMVISLPVVTATGLPLSGSPTPNLTLPKTSIAFGQIAAFSHGWVVLLLAFAAPIPWICRPTRFSLRTLLVATKLVAIGLGMIAGATR
jgi:hypothetical protein